MLTPQDITDKVFVKAVFGGYDMTGVDDFLESISADYTSLYKENAILKGKLKVLVEKVEEYRSTEDAMRMALLTAQRMGEEITSEANKLKEETLKSAEMEVSAKLAETAKQIADEELRLNVAAKETAKFIELSQAIIRKHSEFLTRLETARRAVRSDSSPVVAVSAPGDAAPAVKPTREEQIAQTADMIGHVMDRLTGSGATTAENSVPQSSQDIQDDFDENDDADTKLYKIGNDEELMTPRPKFDFEDLKFGSNFNADE